MTTRTWNDAGLLREYVAQRYALQFATGFEQATFSRVLRHCKRIAQLTGGSRDEIFNQIAAEAA